MSLSKTAPLAEVSLVETVPASIVQSSLRGSRRLLMWAVVAFYGVVALGSAQDADVGWTSALMGGMCLLIPSMLFVIGWSAAMAHELTIRIPTVELGWYPREPGSYTDQEFG